LKNEFALRILHRSLFNDSVISNTTRRGDWPLGLLEFLKVTVEDLEFGVKSSLLSAGVSHEEVDAKMAQVKDIFSKLYTAGEETVSMLKNRLRLAQLPRLLRNVLKGVAS
jgi:hypothetical protein